MEKLNVHLRHGTAEPIETEINGNLLNRIRGLQTSQAIQQILQSLPELERPYGQAMLNTMAVADAVVEVVDLAGEEVITVDSRREESFGELLSKLARRHDDKLDTLEAIEIGTARLEKGGAGSVLGIADQEGRRPGSSPSSITPLPAHPFFAAARRVAFIVLNGEVFRPQKVSKAKRPYFCLDDEQYILEPDQSLEDYDKAYFEDYNDLFEDAINRQALVATQERFQKNDRPVKSSDNLSVFIVNQLVPRLRAFYSVGVVSGDEFRWEDGIGKERLDLLARSKTSRRLQPSLSKIFPKDFLILAPDVYLLSPRRWLFWFNRPDPGVYLRGTTLGINKAPDSALTLEGIESSYMRMLSEYLEQEAAARAPRYTSRLLEQEERTKQVDICNQIRDRSRRESAEFIIYEDTYHGVGAYRGDFFIYRRVPAFILKVNTSSNYYHCKATRLFIMLPSTDPEQLFSRACVRAEAGFRHPLVPARSQTVVMDRCDDDIKRLQSMDLCGALIKHLNDARLMLQTGYRRALSPAVVFRPMSLKQAELMGLPIYNYRCLTSKEVI